MFCDESFIMNHYILHPIGDCILTEAPKHEGNEEMILNYQQNMQDAIDIMHKLQTGIDVNVKFSGWLLEGLPLYIPSNNY